MSFIQQVTVANRINMGQRYLGHGVWGTRPLGRRLEGSFFTIDSLLSNFELNNSY